MRRQSKRGDKYRYQRCRPTEHEYCDYRLDRDSYDSTTECDFADLEIDRRACTSAGGRAVRWSEEKACEDDWGLDPNPIDFTNVYNVPLCLHESCGIGEFVDATNEVPSTCEIEFLLSDDPDTIETPSPDDPDTIETPSSACPPSRVTILLVLTLTLTVFV